MRITTWAEYGLICALHLAKRAGEGPITGREIAGGERLPADYVEQILLRLRRAGLVSSTRGARGGYSLSRAPEEISVREVIAASELGAYDIVEVDPTEPFAANALRIGDDIVYPAEFPRTLGRLRKRGLHVHTVPAGELAKAEGAVTCCSIVFAPHPNGTRTHRHPEGP